MMKPLLILLTLFLPCSLVQAQFILNFGPRTSFFPQETILLEQRNQPQSEVSESTNLTIGASALSITDQRAGLDLGILTYAKQVRSLEYTGFDGSSDNISTASELSINREDLPKRLYKDYYNIGWPFNLGSSLLTIYLGESIVSDQADLTDEDKIKFIDIGWYLNADSDSSWFLGWYYADAFGGIYNVPFAGYLSRSTDLFAVQLVFPVKWSIQAAFSSGWVLGIGQQVEGEVFRLSQETPWNSTLMAFSSLRSRMEIGYQFANGFFLRLEGGTVTDQEVGFFNDTIEISPSGLSQNSYRSDDASLVTFSLKDTSYAGARLSWGF